MGYQTYFIGEFDLDKPLSPEHAAYLRAFSESRRMGRSKDAEALPDPVRIAAGLPLGDDGGYYVGDDGNFFGSSNKGNGIVDYNTPPKGQPGLWCQWVPNEDGTAIVWDDGEKFYEYVAWIAYLIEHFLEPWGYIVNGTVEWDGEEREDIGRIVVENNIVSQQYGTIVYE